MLHAGQLKGLLWWISPCTMAECTIWWSRLKPNSDINQWCFINLKYAGAKLLCTMMDTEICNNVVYSIFSQLSTGRWHAKQPNRPRCESNISLHCISTSKVLCNYFKKCLTTNLRFMWQSQIFFYTEHRLPPRRSIRYVTLMKTHLLTMTHPCGQKAE